MARAAGVSAIADDLPEAREALFAQGTAYVTSRSLGRTRLYFG